MTEETYEAEIASIVDPSIESDRAEGATQDTLEIVIQQGLEMVSGRHGIQRNPTIFRVPAYFSEADKYLHEPRMLSIGPYYHGRKELRSMEEYKWWCLHDMLKLKPGTSMEICLREMRALELRARQCYNERINMSSDNFVLMLLLDSCFILQYNMKWAQGDHDQLVDVGWIQPMVDIDLFLMGNQIPFFVIHKIGSIFYGWLNCQERCILAELIMKFFLHLLPQLSSEIITSCEGANHLLHLSDMCLVPKYAYKQKDYTIQGSSSDVGCLFRFWCWLRCSKPTKASYFKKILCATELSEAGVIFRKKEKPLSMFDITFNNGIMEIPCLEVSKIKKTVLANIAIHEQSDQRCARSRGEIIASYMVLMNLLIDTSADVALLKRCDIIEYILEDDAELVAFFNKSCEYVRYTADEHYYLNLFKQVSEYSNTSWHSYTARLRRDYFSNPWAIISFIAAVILLLLTVTQTGFTIYPVVNHG